MISAETACRGSQGAGREETVFYNKDFDPEKYAAETIAWIREWFEENGKGCNAVIGISGGKDSSIAAALLKEALGKERVIGVMMPNDPDVTEADLADGQKLIDHLGIKGYTVNISGSYDAMAEQVAGALGTALSEQTKINLAPRLRMSALYALSQSVNGRVANTCNLSEDWIGYSTRYGDTAGDFSPLSHFTVQEIKAIGKALGVPAELVEKTPDDGLSGMSDEDKLGFTYDTLDRYIRTGEIDDPVTREKIDRLHRLNLFKLQLMPSFDPGFPVVGM